MIVPSRPDPSSPGPSGPDELANGREKSQGGSGRRRHVSKLPADLLTNRVLPVGGGETRCLGGIRGGTQGVRAHMRNSRSLPRGSGRCRCRGSTHLTSSSTTYKSAADLPGKNKLATREGSRPGDRLTGTAILWSFGLEHPSTRSAQSAAHIATIRRSASLKVCGEPTHIVFHLPRDAPKCPTTSTRSPQETRFRIIRALASDRASRIGVAGMGPASSPRLCTDTRRSAEAGDVLLARSRFAASTYIRARAAVSLARDANRPTVAPVCAPRTNGG